MPGIQKVKNSIFFDAISVNWTRIRMIIEGFLIRQIMNVFVSLRKKILSSLFKVIIGQKFRKKSKCAKSKLNGRHIDYPPAWELIYKLFDYFQVSLHQIK